MSHRFDAFQFFTVIIRKLVSVGQNFVFICIALFYVFGYTLVRRNNFEFIKK